MQWLFLLFQTFPIPIFIQMQWDMIVHVYQSILIWDLDCIKAVSLPAGRMVYVYMYRLLECKVCTVCLIPITLWFYKMQVIQLLYSMDFSSLHSKLEGQSWAYQTELTKLKYQLRMLKKEKEQVSQRRMYCEGRNNKNQVWDGGLETGKYRNTHST